MSDDTGGKMTSAVPVGTVGTSLVAGADPEVTARANVVATSAGAWMTPMMTVVVEAGARSSSDCANPNATSAAATTAPTVTTMRVLRDRRSGSIGSTTTTTLSR
jgi:hypothetical protein